MRSVLFPAICAILAACGSSAPKPKQPVAREVGKIAFEATREAERAAKKAGLELKKATHEAHEGWKEAQRDEKKKPTR